MRGGETSPSLHRGAECDGSFPISANQGRNTQVGQPIESLLGCLQIPSGQLPIAQFPLHESHDTFHRMVVVKTTGPDYLTNFKGTSKES